MAYVISRYVKVFFHPKILILLVEIYLNNYFQKILTPQFNLVFMKAISYKGFDPYDLAETSIVLPL